MSGAIARSKPASTPAPSRKRRLKWTCRYCQHTFTTWTRAGLRVTCKNPRCGRVQEGPAGIERMAERLGELQPRAAAPAKPSAVKVVAVKPSPAEPAPAVKPKTKSPAAQTAPAREAGVNRPPAPPAQKPKPGLFDRVVFGAR